MCYLMRNVYLRQARSGGWLPCSYPAHFLRLRACLDEDLGELADRQLSFSPVCEDCDGHRGRRLDSFSGEGTCRFAVLRTQGQRGQVGQDSCDASDRGISCSLCWWWRRQTPVAGSPVPLGSSLNLLSARDASSVRGTSDRPSYGRPTRLTRSWLPTTAWKPRASHSCRLQENEGGGIPRSGIPGRHVRSTCRSPPRGGRTDLDVRSVGV